MTKEKKVLHMKNLAEDMFTARKEVDGTSGALKMVAKTLLRFPYALTKMAFYAIIPPKAMNIGYYAPKDVVEWHESRAKGLISYKTAIKIATHADTDAAERGLKKMYNSFAAHAAIDKAIARAKDYSDDQNLVPVRYKTRGNDYHN